MPAIAFVPVALILNYSGMGFFASILWSLPITVGLFLVIVILGMLRTHFTKDATAAKRKVEIDKLRETVLPLVDSHMSALLRKKRTSVVVDDYGVVEDRKWQAEVDRFVESVLLPRTQLGKDFRFRAGQTASRADLASIVRDMVAAAQADAEQSFVSLFDKTMSPTEYEHFCAGRLKAAGWKATVTKASGDQGADVIATRGKDTVIIQCKHYAKPVGNKAVQEAAAAMRHYNSDHAVVVATNGFTKAAYALAATNGVLLLGHDDLTADWRVPA